MAGLVGVEPTHDRVKVYCLTTWLQPNNMVGSDGFEPPKHEVTDLQSAAFGHFANYPLYCILFVFIKQTLIIIAVFKKKGKLF